MYSQLKLKSRFFADHRYRLIFEDECRSVEQCLGSTDATNETTMSPPQIAQDLFGCVDGRQLVEFLSNTEERENAVLPVSVNAISFLRRLVAQFGGHRLEPDDLLEGTLPTADNRAMARECLQMDDGTHSQQTKHSRAMKVIDRLGLAETGRHGFAGSNKWNFGSSLVVHALMSAVGPIAFATNPQLNMCFEGELFGSVDGRQLVPFVRKTNESGENAVPVNAISFLCRLVAQFGGVTSLGTGRLLEGTLPTTDNRAMALECLQMDDDDIHNQQTKHSRAKEVIDRLGLAETGRHGFAGSNKWNFGSSLVLHALMSAVGPIAFATNPQLNMCFEGRALITGVSNMVQQQATTIETQARTLASQIQMIIEKDRYIAQLQGYIRGMNLHIPPPPLGGQFQPAAGGHW
ncbi:hypothetical protein niasHT_001952 [Heterodera trifolii]|uniref:Uncharacterized protein n=1 Tax=Heterodera trifolii TaxID=157864 RepID=A0ABD2M358_9BILA